jgi:hypothetical protein
MCVAPTVLKRTHHPFPLLRLSFVPKCGVIIEVFAASITPHVPMQIHSGYLICRPRRRQRQLAVRQLYPQLYFCNSLHMYTYQMDTCMGMGFIDADQSRTPKVTSIDPTSGPRAGGSQIVVAGSGDTRCAYAIARCTHSTAVTSASLSQASSTPHSSPVASAAAAALL